MADNHAVFTLPNGLVMDPLKNDNTLTVDWGWSDTYTTTTSTGNSTQTDAEQRARALIDQLQNEGKEWRRKAQVSERELTRLARLMMVLVRREGGTIVFTDTELGAVQGGRLIYDDEQDAAGLTRLHAIPDFVAIGSDEEPEAEPERPDLAGYLRSLENGTHLGLQGIYQSSAASQTTLKRRPKKK